MITLPGDIKGKTALITGSTSGIGLGIAKALAEAGANIVMNGFGEPDAIEAERLALEKHGITAIYSAADMSKPEQIQEMIDWATETFGSIDILVNNAGFQNVQPVEDFDPAKWDSMVAIMLSGAFHTIRHCVGGMRKNGWGRIINLVSAHGYVASPYKTGYVAVKHGLMGLTKTVALETAQDNITCNAICPGYVHTYVVDSQVKDTAQARGISEKEVMEDVLLAAQHTKKFVTTEQIGGFALFLCSDVAENITGAGLSIDGGWTAA